MVIFNPRAARGHPAGRRRLEQLLRRAGVAFELLETRTPGETRTAAREAAEAGRTPVGAGGDGTAHEIVNGVLSSARPDAAVAFLPLGTGNDLVRNVGMDPPDLAAAVRALATPRLRRIDVGQVNEEEYFVNGLGIGFDAEVVRRRQGSRPPRWPSYFPTIVRTLLTYRSRCYRVERPGGSVIEGPALMVVAMNGPSLGGGFRLAPSAEPDDGRLDVCHVDPLGLLTFVRYVRAVRRGTHVGLPFFRMWRVERLTVTCEEGLSYEMDGEYRERGPGERLEIQVRPACLTLVA